MATSPEARTNFEALGANEQLGQGFVVGLTATGNVAQVYWVTAEDDTDRRNQLVGVEDGIVKISVVDEEIVSPEQLDLMQYNAMRSLGPKHVVSNGKQTDALILGLHTRSFNEIISEWNYKPAPISTPHISALMDTGLAGSLEISVIRKNPGSEEPIPMSHSHRRPIRNLEDGEGFGVHTFIGDGNPPPSVNGKPIPLPLGKGIEDTVEMYWEMLSPHTRIAVVVKGIDATTGEITHSIRDCRE